MLKIWGRATSTNVQKVLWLCGELALPFERLDLGGPFGGLDDPAYREKNPNGLIPTLEDESFILWESHAILRYLEATHPGSGLMPQDIKARAIVDQWLDWQMVALGLSLRDLYMILFRPGDTVPTEAAIARTAQLAERQFILVEQRLQVSPYVGGDQFSLADIAVGISAHRWFAMPVERTDTPALRAWYDVLAARPAFAPIASTPLR